MYKKILMPVDVFEMDLSDKAVEHADFLASSEGGNIYMLHVFPKSAKSSLGGFSSDARQLEHMISSEAVLKMKRLASRFKTAPDKIHHEVRFGSVRDMVNNAVRDLDADVVVIGSRSPDTLSAHLLGSTASSVIRYARIPVFVIR